MNEPWAVGAVVGGAYQLEGPIGKGGFGAVFRGRRLSDREPVAIKLLSRTAMVREDGIARFKREAELAMLLKHESTIRVLDSGDAGDGTPYIAFELLEGTSLDQVLEHGGPLSQERAVAVALALLGSLGEAHALGIVHRDVKPANVFMCDHVSGLVKLLDFGVAKSTVSSDLSLTAEGLMVGTPAYMAPEQISGREVSPATDLYAVALVVAEVLTGRPVYDAAPLQVCMDKVRGLPRPFDEFVRGLSFFEVLERATCTEPHARYASAEEMTAALLVASRRASTSAPPLGRTSLSSRPPGNTEIIEVPFSSDPRPADARSLSAEAQQAARRDVIAALSSTIPIATPRRLVAPLLSGPTSSAAPSAIPTSGAAHSVGSHSSPGVSSSQRRSSDHELDRKSSDRSPEALASTMREEDGHAVVVPSRAAGSEPLPVAYPPTQTIPLPAEARALTRSLPTQSSATTSPTRRLGLALFLVAALLVALATVLAWLFQVPPFGKTKRRPKSTSTEREDAPRRRSAKSSAKADTDDDDDDDEKESADDSY